MMRQLATQDAFAANAVKHLDNAIGPIQPASTGDPEKSIVQLTYWWPVHRPYFVSGYGPWSPTPQNNAGDLQMVIEWSLLGFVTKTPDNPDQPITVVEDDTAPS